MKTCCNVGHALRTTDVDQCVARVGSWYPTAASATCNVTSNGSGSVGRITKFTPTSCNVENSVIFESSGKVGIGAPASGGFEFQVSAPNQIGLLIEGPASGVGAGLQFKTTGTGGLDLGDFRHRV
jgi:hypothetical protein